MAHRSARYDYGGDRYVFVEFSIDMELAQNFKTLSMAEAIKQAAIPGVVEVIPSICSMLVEYDRTRIHADSLIGRLKSFIQALCATPYWTVMVGFTPGLPWLYPLGVSNEEAIQAPKYNRPRTWTPDRSVGLGGAFLAIYSVRNPGGYQLLGRTTNPIYDARQRHPDFMENPVLLKPGDILKWRSVSRDEYDAIWAGVEDGSYRFGIRKVTVGPEAYLRDPRAYTKALLEGS